MSLQRRLLLYLLLCAPLVWAVAAWTSMQRARHEIDELFDTEMIRLARQVQATLRPAPMAPGSSPSPGDTVAGIGSADVEDLALAVWDATGQLLLVDREGGRLRWRPDAIGFVDETLEGEAWRIYYLPTAGGDWLVAAAQRLGERAELSQQLTGSQLLTWIAALPVLLLAMAIAVRQALGPVRRLAQDLHGRDPADLQPVAEADVPVELRPLAEAMNALFRRVDAALARERRFTADAAHELRTPLTVLRLQWDVLCRARDEGERARAAERLGAGFERMDRLVAQLLALSRIEGAGAAPSTAPVHWPRIVEQVVNDVLALAERRQIELDCDASTEGAPPWPLQADEHLVTVLLRNLVDNAVRYAPTGSTVRLRIGPDRLVVDNDGPALPVGVLDRLGERFYRPEGQAEPGSGLGISIVRRIAALYGLQVDIGARHDGAGVRVTVRPAAPG